MSASGRISVFVLLLCAMSVVQAQNKANLQLQLKIERMEQQRAGQEYPLLLMGDTAAIRQEVAALGGSFKYAYGNIAAVRVPVSNVNAISSSPNVLRVQDMKVPVVNLLDTSLIVNGVDQVHAGNPPLISPYTGKGVLVGVIDAGIDFNHFDFRHADSSTRIRYIWEQSASTGGTTPQPYGFGQEWNWLDINNGLCTHSEGTSGFGHGSHVAGIAAGNAGATGNYRGVAYESDLIIVDYKNSQFLENVVDGIDYIFDKATAMGMPCVINTSIGTYYGSHDGLDLASVMISNMIRASNGRMVVGAAGNAGHTSFHIRHNVTATPQFTWYQYYPSVSSTLFSFFGDSSDLRDVVISISADEPGTWTAVPGNHVFNPGSWNLSGDTVFQYSTILNHGGGSNSTVIVYVEFFNGVYEVVLSITPANTNWYWRLQSSGSGKLDSWSSTSLTGTSNFVFSTPDSATYPPIVNYVRPDNEMTHISSWQNAEEVISVGNYVGHRNYLDVDSNIVDMTFSGGGGLTVGDIVVTSSNSSSRGPTRDGRIKPDIAASGYRIMSAGNPNWMSAVLSSNRWKAGLGAQHFTNTGTSMSAPFVAGAVALYLEKKPNAGWREIYEVFARTAMQDSFTTTAVNPTWGHGKLDAMAALTYNALPGCMDTGSVNYDPLANIDDGSCIAKVWGCTDAASINYDPNANVDDGSCIPMVRGCMDSAALNYNPLANMPDTNCQYPSTGIAVPGALRAFDLYTYPNPFEDAVTFRLHGELDAIGSSEIRVFSPDGRLVGELKLEAGATHLQWSTAGLAKGVYIYRWSAGKQPMGQGRLLKQ